MIGARARALVDPAGIACTLEGAEIERRDLPKTEKKKKKKKK